MNKMKFTGQGPTIFYKCIPFVIFAVILQIFFPSVMKLHVSRSLSLVIGCIMLILGLSLWYIGFRQLMKYFSKGKLITTGLFRFCRNPLYASIILFMIPSISFFTNQSSYFLIAFISWLSFIVNIGIEEKNLKNIFGKEYESYVSRVNRFFPWFHR